MKNTLLNTANLVRINWLWIVANTVGFGIFLYTESRLALHPFVSEPFTSHDIIGSASDMISQWFEWECPLLIVFLLLNMIWLYRIIRPRNSNPTNQSFIVWLLICLAWVCAISVYGISIPMITKIIPMLIRRAIRLMIS